MSTLNEILINATLTARPFVVGEYTVTVSEIPGGHRLAVTRGGQTQTADILDGVPPSLDELTEQVGKNTYMLDLLYKLTRGQAWDAEQKTITAYKTDVPAGSHAMALEMLSGQTVAFNQLAPNGGGVVHTISGHKYFLSSGTTKTLRTSTGEDITVEGGDMLIDLTHMFGAAVAGSILSPEMAIARGVPDTYIGFNTGVLKHAAADSIVFKDGNGQTVDTFEIPAAVRSKPCYGMSAPGAFNQIIYNNDVWRYAQYADFVNLGTLTWTENTQYSVDGKHIYMATFAPIKLSGDYRMMCDKYAEFQASVGVDLMPNKTVKCQNALGRLYIRDDDYTTESAFNAYMASASVSMTYAMATPTSVDITSLMPTYDLLDCLPDCTFELHQSDTTFKIAAQMRGTWFVNLHEKAEAMSNE